MKKVRSPKQIKTKIASNKVKSSKSVTESIDRAKNPMLNKEALKGKTGGTNLGDYNLDLMKLG